MCCRVDQSIYLQRTLLFQSVILKLLKKDNIRALDENAINKYVKEYEKNRKEKQNGSMMIRCFARRFYMHRR